ncbi:UNVERIFIED_CONTAM: hypothetical protein FKN15_059650 [Acipenser sinensis]
MQIRRHRLSPMKQDNLLKVWLTQESVLDTLISNCLSPEKPSPIRNSVASLCS